MHKVRLLIKLSWIFVPHRDRCQCCQSLLLWGCQRWGTTDDDSVGANANGEHEADMEDAEMVDAEVKDVTTRGKRRQTVRKKTQALSWFKTTGTNIWPNAQRVVTYLARVHFFKKMPEMLLRSPTEEGLAADSTDDIKRIKSYSRHKIGAKKGYIFEVETIGGENKAIPYLEIRKSDAFTMFLAANTTLRR
jgi:hypothetical protein